MERYAVNSNSVQYGKQIIECVFFHPLVHTVSAEFHNAISLKWNISPDQAIRPLFKIF